MYQPQKSNIFQAMAHLKDGLKLVYTYLTNVNNGVKCRQPKVPDIFGLAFDKYAEWQELVQQSTYKKEINCYRKLMRDLAWEVQKLGSDILVINNDKVEVSKRKRKLLDFPVITKIGEQEISALDRKYQQMLELLDTYSLIRKWFIEKEEIPMVKDIVRRINETKEAQQIFADNDVSNLVEQSHSLYIAEKTWSEKKSGIGYIVKTCGNNYLDLPEQMELPRDFTGK